MKLSELAKKPQLIKLTIEKEEIIEKYGDALDFYMYDRQPLDIFSKMADVNTDNAGEYINILKNVILKEDGTPVISEEEVLPMDVLTEAMVLIGDRLGK